MINFWINIFFGFLLLFDCLNVVWDLRVCNFFCLLYWWLFVMGIRLCGWDLEVGGFFGVLWCDVEVFEVCGVCSRVYGSVGGFIYFCLGVMEKVSLRSRCLRWDWLVFGFFIVWGWEEVVIVMVEKFLDFI